MPTLSYKYKIYPTNQQVDLFEKTLEAVIFVYNKLYRSLLDNYTEFNTELDLTSLNKILLDLKLQNEFLNEVSSVALQQVLREVSLDFKHYIKTKIQKFKNISDFKKSFKLTKNVFSIKNNKIKLAKCKESLHLKPAWNTSDCSSVLVLKDLDQYFLIATYESSTTNINIDETCSITFIEDGFIFNDMPNSYPSCTKLKNRILKLKAIQNFKIQNSNNYLRIAKKIYNLSKRLRNTQFYYLHNISAYIASNYKTILINESISCNLSKEFVRQLKYKAKLNNGIVKVTK